MVIDMLTCFAYRVETEVSCLFSMKSVQDVRIDVINHLIVGVKIPLPCRYSGSLYRSTKSGYIVDTIAGIGFEEGVIRKSFEILIHDGSSSPFKAIIGTLTLPTSRIHFENDDDSLTLMFCF